MYFKFTNRNPYRDFVRNVRRIATSTEVNKFEEYKNLQKLIMPKLLENEKLLNNQAAFHKSYEHWNQRDIAGIRTVTNDKNPWLRFKREFESAMTNSEEVALRAIEISLAWFYAGSYNDDWIQD